MSDDDLTFSGMRPKGEKWKRARRVEEPTLALQRLEHEIEDARELIRDLSLALMADANLIAARVHHRGTDVVDGTAIFGHAMELVAAQTMLDEKRKRAHELRAGGA
jgi:hypothetical protein